MAYASKKNFFSKAVNISEIHLDFKIKKKAKIQMQWITKNSKILKNN